jgi:hypothetical protein
MLIELQHDESASLVLTLTEGLDDPIITTAEFVLFAPSIYHAQSNPYAYTPVVEATNKISSDALRIALGTAMIVLAFAILGVYCLCKTKQCLRSALDKKRADPIELKTLRDP